MDSSTLTTKEILCKYLKHRSVYSQAVLFARRLHLGSQLQFLPSLKPRKPKRSKGKVTRNVRTYILFHSL